MQRLRTLPLVAKMVVFGLVGFLRDEWQIYQRSHRHRHA